MADEVRPPGVRLAEVILLVLMAGDALFGVARPLLGPGGLGLAQGSFFGQPPTIEITLKDSVTLVPAMPSLGGGLITPGHGAEIHAPYRAQVQLFTLDWRERLGVTGSQVLAGLVAVGVLVIIWLIVRSLQQGEEFRARNIRLLVVMAFLVGIGGEAVVLLSAWGRLAVLDEPLVKPYATIDAGFTFLPLLAAVGILVGAEVFRRGQRLRDDVEGLV